MTAPATAVVVTIEPTITPAGFCRLVDAVVGRLGEDEVDALLLRTDITVALLQPVMRACHRERALLRLVRIANGIRVEAA